MAISEGIFNDIGSMNIKVNNKYGINNSNLEDVIIHKTNQYNDNTIVIKAKNGKLISDEFNDKYDKGSEIETAADDLIDFSEGNPFGTF